MAAEDEDDEPNGVGKAAEDWLGVVELVGVAEGGGIDCGWRREGVLWLELAGRAERSGEVEREDEDSEDGEDGDGDDGLAVGWG